MLLTANQRANPLADACVFPSVTPSKNTGSRRMDRAWMGVHDVVSASDFMSFILQGKGKIASHCPLATGLFNTLQSRDKDKEHLFVTADLLHCLFYLWEVQIDFPPLVTLKSQLFPFCHTLKECRGVRIKGLGSRSCTGGKQPEELGVPFWAFYVSNLFQLRRKDWLSGWTTCKVLTWHKFFSFFS